MSVRRGAENIRSDMLGKGERDKSEEKKDQNSNSILGKFVYMLEVNRWARLAPSHEIRVLLGSGSR